MTTKRRRTIVLSVVLVAVAAVAIVRLRDTGPDRTRVSVLALPVLRLGALEEAATAAAAE